MTNAHVEKFDAFLGRIGSGTASWVGKIRQDAIARFTELGFPTTRNEDWHFTSVSPISESDFHVTEAPGG